MNDNIRHEMAIELGMKQVQLNLGRIYQLHRITDGAGDSGSLLHPVDRMKGEQYVDRNGWITVGMAVLCGSARARSYSAQDYWLTSNVTEILDVSTDGREVKFATGNSIYVAQSIK